MEKIGMVDVDSGTVWVGDPCYVLGADASHGVKDWSEFCDKVDWGANGGTYREVLGEGVGISVQAGYGDGSYPVYIERGRDGVVKRLIIDFGDDDDAHH